MSQRVFRSDASSVVSRKRKSNKRSAPLIFLAIVKWIFNTGPGYHSNVVADNGVTRVRTCACVRACVRARVCVFRWRCVYFGICVLNNALGLI